VRAQITLVFVGSVALALSVLLVGPSVLELALPNADPRLFPMLALQFGVLVPGSVVSYLTVIFLVGSRESRVLLIVGMCSAIGYLASVMIGGAYGQERLTLVGWFAVESVLLVAIAYYVHSKRSIRSVASSNGPMIGD
jgi:hypothetical protein